MLPGEVATDLTGKQRGSCPRSFLVLTPGSDDTLRPSLSEGVIPLAESPPPPFAFDDFPLSML